MPYEGGSEEETEEDTEIIGEDRYPTCIRKMPKYLEAFDLGN